MNPTQPRDNRATAADSVPVTLPAWHARWYGRLLLLIASVLLLTLAFAPFEQFYLAWVGLVPWLWIVAGVKSKRAAFLWSWLGGILFFSANMWWIARISAIGAVGLMIYLGLFWALVGMIIRGTRLLELGIRGPWERGVSGVLLIATIWVVSEYIRGTFLTGLPWLFLGHTQSPFLASCQIADVLGVYGVTFWVVTVNVLLVLFLQHRPRAFSLIPATTMVVFIVGATVCYGFYRRVQTERTTSPGPLVAVIQPNYPQNNHGDKSGDPLEQLQFHEDETARAINAVGKVDVVAWTETMMPAVNSYYRAIVREIDPKRGALNDTIYDHLTALTTRYNTHLITGSLFYDRMKVAADGYVTFADRRNCAYLIEPGVNPSELPHYDKVHLVPFGEFLPFKESVPWLHDLFMKLGPYNFDYTLTRGDAASPTIFAIRCAGLANPVRFVTPICYEDVDASLCAQLINGSGKRADVLINLTNDGWFAGSENAQHVQMAQFRSIENRVPTARSVNTGISCFIDSYGRVVKALPARAAGSLTMQMTLDSRQTFYGRHGDWFVVLCMIAVTGIMAHAVIRRKAIR